MFFRCYIGINPDRGIKARQAKIVSMRTGRVVKKKSVTVYPHVSTLLKNLIDFEWISYRSLRALYSGTSHQHSHGYSPFFVLNYVRVIMFLFSCPLNMLYST